MDVATVVIDIRLKGAKDVGAGVGDVGKQSRATGEQVDGLRGRLTRLFTEIKEKGQTIAGHANMDGLIGKVMSLAAAYVSLRTVMDFVRAGFNFSAEMETSRIGIASVITATSDLVDQQGRILQGQEAYNAALGISDQIMNRVRIMGLETTATTGELVAGFQSMIAPATAVGMTMEQTQDFTLNMVKALGAMGIPLNQLSAEGRSLLDGTIIPTQDRLAIALGITGDMVKNWKAQGTHVQELQKRLEPFALAGQDVANTWAGLSSNMNDALGVLSGFTGSGFFTSVKAAYKDILDSIVDVKNAKPGEDIANIANAVKTLQDYLGGLVQGAASSFISWLQEMNKPENLSVLEQRVKGIWEGLEAAANHAAVAVDCIGSVFGASIDGWNSMPDVIKEMGIVGALLFGTKVKLALLGVGAVIDLASRLNVNSDKYAGMNAGDVDNLLESYGLGSSPVRGPALSGSRSVNPDAPNPFSQFTPPTLANSHSYADAEKAHTELLNVLSQQDAQYAKESVTITQSALGDMAKAQDLYKNSMKQSSQERIVAIKAEFSTAIEANQKAIAARQRVAQSALMGASTPAERQTIEAEAANSIAVFQSNIAALTQEQNRQITAITSKTTAEMRQVTKAAEEVSRDITKLEGELLALNAATREDGTVDKQALGVLKAKAQAQQEFKAACGKGVSEELAAKRMALQVALAEKKQIEENTQVQQQFYSQFGQMFKDRTDLALRALEKEEQAFRDAGVAEVDLERWKQRRLLEIRQDAAAGVERALQKYTEEANNQAAQTEQITTKLVNGMENSLTSAFDSFVEKGKISFNSFKSLFSGFLSDLIRMAVAKPITVKIAGAVSGALGFGGNGTAKDEAGGGDALGLAGQLPWSSMLPDSLTGGISSIFGSALPGTGAMAPVPAGFMGPMPGMSGLSLTGALGYGGLGAMGYTMLGGAIGLPQSPYSGLTSAAGGTLGAWGGSALASGLTASGAIAAGGMMGSVIPVVGTIIGALAGGLLGSALGGYKDKPGLWLNANVDLSKQQDAAGMESTYKDRKHPWSWYTHEQGDGYLVQSRNRDGMAKGAAEQAVAYIEGIVEQQMAVSDAITTAIGGTDTKLAEQYTAALKTLGNVGVAQDWEDEEPDIEGFGKRVVSKTQEQMYKALSTIDISPLTTAADGAAVNAQDEIFTALTKAFSLVALGEGLGEYQQQWAQTLGEKVVSAFSSVDMSGLRVDFDKNTAAGLYKAGAAVQGWIQVRDAIDLTITPLSEYQTLLNAGNAQMDTWIQSLRALGWQEAALAEVEARRADYMSAITAEMDRAFRQEISSRQAALETNDQYNSILQLTAQHENELVDARKKYGEASSQYAQIVALQAKEMVKATEAVRAALAGLHSSLAVRAASVISGDGDAAALAALQARQAEEMAQTKRDDRSYRDLMVMDSKVRELNATGYQGRRDWDTASLIDAISKAGMTTRQWIDSYGVTEKHDRFDDQAVLDSKVRELNSTGYQGRRDWDTTSLIDAISKAGMTTRQWIDNYGVAEGHTNKGTGYVDAMEAVHKAEYAQLVAQQAQAAADKAKAAVSSAQSAYDSLTSQLSGFVSQLRGMADEFANAAQRVGDTRQQLWQSSADPLGLTAQRDTAMAEFDRLSALAMGGDSAAAQEMSGMADSLLALLRETSATSGDYMEAFYGVDAKLKAAQKAQQEQYDAAMRQITALEAQYGIQVEQKLTQDQILAKISGLQPEITSAYAALQAAIAAQTAAQAEASNKMLVAMKAQADAQAAADAAAAAAEAQKKAQEAAQKYTGTMTSAQITALSPAATAAINGQYGGSFALWWQGAGSKQSMFKDVTWQGYKASDFNGYGGSTYSTLEALMAAKAKSMNATVDWVKAEIQKHFPATTLDQSVRHWYAQYGRQEQLEGAYAAGGNAPAGWILAGEEGPEIIKLPTPARVINSRDSAHLWRSEGKGAGSDTIAAIITVLMAAVNELRSDLSRITVEDVRIRRAVENLADLSERQYVEKAVEVPA